MLHAHRKFAGVRRTKVHVQRDDRREYTERNDDRGEEDVLADERHGEAGGGHQLQQQQLQ